MKYIKLFSFLTIFITVTAIIISITNSFSINKISQKHIPNSYDSLMQQLKRFEEYSNQSSGDSISDKEYRFLLIELQQQLNEQNSQTTAKFDSATENEFKKQTFWIKVIFSSIFCISALFVILSKKYDEETKKWAFSVLTLIAGVWIGTIS